jgi:hypothetical protein
MPIVIHPVEDLVAPSISDNFPEELHDFS